MANVEKHPKQPMEQIEQAELGAVPTCTRSPRLIGHYIKNRQEDLWNRVPYVESRARGVILRIEDLPATPRNIERIRERIRSLNRRLAESGTPFRLKVV